MRFTKGKSAGFPKSRQVSKPRDQYLELLDGSEIWQAAPQYYCGDACQISEPSSNSKDQSRDFETWRDLRKPADFPLVKRIPVPL